MPFEHSNALPGLDVPHSNRRVLSSREDLPLIQAPSESRYRSLVTFEFAETLSGGRIPDAHASLITGQNAAPIGIEG